MQRRSLVILAVAALTVAGFLMLFHKYGVKTSTIDNVAELRYELGCRDINQASCVEDWMWEQRTPYKYRLLGRMSMWPLYEVCMAFGIDQDRAIYYSWITFSLLFTASTLFLLALLMRILLDRINPGLPRRTRIMIVGLAWTLFALSPPILFFVKYPVRGAPNDLLGYSLMLGALLCLSIRRIAWFSAISIVAVFCRETTLLVPFIFLLFDPQPLRAKLLPALAPVAALALLRLLWPGTYDALSAGIRLNLKFPVETASFLLITFGPLWILGALGYVTLRRLPAARNDPFVRLLIDSFPWALLLALGVSTAFASLWEIRIVFMLFLYFVPFSAIALYRYRARIAVLPKNKYFILFIVAVLVETIRFWLWMHPAHLDQLYDRVGLFDLVYIGYRNTPQYNWINILVACQGLVLVCLPLLAFAAPTAVHRCNDNPEIRPDAG